MKKRDLILIIIISLLALSVWGMNLFFNQGNGGQLLITVDNQLYGRYDLSVDQCISINDTNECLITDGSVSMIYADCPDKVCVHSAPISRNGQTIICMPNQVVLEIVNDAYNPIDIMAE